MTPEQIREWDKTFDDKAVTAEVARARARIEIAAQLSELNQKIDKIYFPTDKGAELRKEMGAQGSTERCPDCDANARDWLLIAKELGCEPIREEMCKVIRKLQAELRKEEVMPTGTIRYTSDTRPSGEDKAGGPIKLNCSRNYLHSIHAWNGSHVCNGVPVNTTTIPGGGSPQGETGRVKLSGVQDPSRNAQIVGGPSAESPWREIARLSEQERIELFTLLGQWSRNIESQAEKVTEWFERRQEGRIALAVEATLHCIAPGISSPDAIAKRMAELLEQQVVALGLKQKRNSFNQTA